MTEIFAKLNIPWNIVLFTNYYKLSTKYVFLKILEKNIFSTRFTWALSSEQWAVRSESWAMSSEKWEVSSEQWEGVSDKGVGSNENLAVNSEQ